MALRWRFWKRKPALVRQLIVEHMGGTCDEAETVSHTIKPIERVNLQLVLDRWMQDEGAQGGLVGYVVGSFFSNAEIAQLLQEGIAQAPVQREQFERSPGEYVDCVTRGVYLLRHEGKPVVILLSTPESRFDT